MSKEAMKLMVHEMEYVLDCINNHVVPFDGDDFHEALRLGKEALAKQSDSVSVGEPVAWGVHDQIALNKTLSENSQQRTAAEGEDTRRAWVGLTIGEIQDLIQFKEHSPFALAEDIEAKLKEKNSA